MLELPILTCKKEVEDLFSVGTEYEVQAYMPKLGGLVMVVNEEGAHHFMDMDWLSEHFYLEGELELMLEEV